MSLSMNYYATMHSAARSYRRIGALPDDLNSFDGTIIVGDGYLAAGELQNAIGAYQAAGQTGATTLGPEIDAATGGASQPLTQQAWKNNDDLSKINNTSNATSTDAYNAQNLIKQMQGLYHQALANQQQGGGGGGPTQPSQALTAAASALVAYFQSNGCTQSSVSQVVAFQTQYNAEGSTPIAADGKYGPATQGALQRVLTASGGGTAPQNCFTSSGGGSSGGGGGGGGGGGTTPTTPAPTQAGMLSWGTGALVAAAAAAAIAVGYELNKKHGKRLLHRAGHHARRAHHALRHRLLRRRHG